MCLACDFCWLKDARQKLSLQSNQNKSEWRTFVTRVANKKRCLHSSRRLLWSSRMGWQAVSTAIFEWLLKDARQNYLSRAIKRKVNDKPLWREKPTRNNACVLADDYRGPRGWVDLQFQPQSSNDFWIFDWRCGWTIASSRRITCLKEGQTKWSFPIKLNKSVMTKSGCVEEDFVLQEITDKSILLKTPSIAAPSVTCFGLVTCRVKVRQLETGCPP